jgi:UDP-N-acetylglucosamine acyltransferase
LNPQPSQSSQAPQPTQANIHPTAIVAPGAQIPASCTVGPYCTIGPNVILGEDCELISHVVLDGHLTMGSRNRIFSFACLGVAPQDLKYAGEPTGVRIGSDNSIREYVTISRGTIGGGGLTTLGDHCLIMCSSHIGHDSHVGSHCILANAATLAGHVDVEDFAVVGALCAVHQFCRIGLHAYIGGGTVITQDVLPYSLTSAERNSRAYGLNKVGLERRGFTAAELKELRAAYRLLLASKLNTSAALAAIRETIAAGTAGEHVTYLADFIANSKRGIIK